MANSLTNLIPSTVQAFDVVSRELVGFIPSVNRDPRADRVAKNQTLYSFSAPAATLSDITPGAASPSAGDKTIGNKSLTISNYKMTDFYFTGEEEYALTSSSGNYGNIVTDMIEQGIRAITNQMELDIWTAANLGASRAYGTVSTTPFTTNTGEAAQIKKILDDNGAPMGTRTLVVDTTTSAQLRTLTQLAKVNEAGSSMTLRDGELLNLSGLSIKESAQVSSFTKGTLASSPTVNNAGYAVGATTLTLTASVGTGTILAGDVLTFAGDTNQYVVATGNADVSAGNTIVLQAPGLRKAMSAATKAITIIATSTRNLAFSRNAILLATRLPAIPTGGDIADARETITDSRSGISIELAAYRQYRQIRYELSCAWGVSVIKPEHIAALLY